MANISFPLPPPVCSVFAARLHAATTAIRALDRPNKLLLLFQVFKAFSYVLRSMYYTRLFFTPVSTALCRYEIVPPGRWMATAGGRRPIAPGSASPFARTLWLLSTAQTPPSTSHAFPCTRTVSLRNDTAFDIQLNAQVGDGSGGWVRFKRHRLIPAVFLFTLFVERRRS